jgi:hypothetical protein
MSLGELHQALLKFFESFDTVKINLVYGSSRKVQMRILKAGNHKPSMKIDDDRVRGCQRLGVFVAANCQNLVAAHGKGLRLRPGVILSPYLPVQENAVRVSRWCLSQAAADPQHCCDENLEHFSSHGLASRVKRTLDTGATE